MKAEDYRAFKSMVARADAQSEVWWAGFYWIDLTRAQCRDILAVLETKSFIKATKTLSNQDALLMPSGLMIHY